MLDLILWLPLLALVAGGLALFYVIVVERDPYYNEPLEKRLLTWAKNMVALIFRAG